MIPTRLQWIVVASRLFLGGFFVLAGLAKLPDPQVFLQAQYQYGIYLPDPLFQVVTLSLPWLEVLCGFCLIAGVFLPGALFLVWTQLLVFTSLTAQAWIRGLRFDCGCFGALTDYPTLPLFTWLSTVPGATLRNLTLLALASALVWVHLEQTERKEETRLGSG